MQARASSWRLGVLMSLCAALIRGRAVSRFEVVNLDAWEVAPLASVGVRWRPSASAMAMERVSAWVALGHAHLIAKSP